MKCLVKATGWIGDAYFALSLPDKLKNELGYSQVDFVTYRPQPLILLSQNKYIDNVYLAHSPDDSIYDTVFDLPGFRNKTIQQTVQFQTFCGIKNTAPEFYVDTCPDFDKIATLIFDCLDANKIKIAYQADWNDRRWEYSEDEYNAGLVNKHGNIEYVINELSKINTIELIKISPHMDNLFAPFHKNHIDPRGFCTNPTRYAILASVIKQCDYFLGCEGGLSNLAAGLGTTCITTMCHFYKCFGPKGLLAPNQDELMYGPEKIFPNAKHKNLSPFITDQEILETIINIVL